MAVDTLLYVTVYAQRGDGLLLRQMLDAPGGVVQVGGKARRKKANREQTLRLQQRALEGGASADTSVWTEATILHANPSLQSQYPLKTIHSSSSSLNTNQLLLFSS